MILSLFLNQSHKGKRNFNKLLRRKKNQANFQKILTGKKAERFLKLFQRNSQFYIMTGDTRYFYEMKQEMLDELEIWV